MCICPYYLCYITSLAWDKTDKFMVTGCSEGIIRTWNLSTYSKHLFAENTLFAHYNSVISLEFSTSNKYLCSSSVDGLVRLWHWPILEPHFEIFSTSPVRVSRYSMFYFHFDSYKMNLGYCISSMERCNFSGWRWIRRRLSIRLECE